VKIEIKMAVRLLRRGVSLSAHRTPSWFAPANTAVKSCCASWCGRRISLHCNRTLYPQAVSRWARACESWPLKWSAS